MFEVGPDGGAAIRFKTDSFVDAVRWYRRIKEAVILLSHWSKLCVQARQGNCIQVSPDGSFRSISEALRIAKPNDLIAVHPGTYSEHLVLNKNDLTIRAVGVAGTVTTINSSGGNAVSCTGQHCVIHGFYLKQSPGEKLYTIDVRSGELIVVACDISGQGLACVAVQSEAKCVLVHNKIHSGKTTGITVFNRGQVVLRDNDVCYHEMSCIEVRRDANATLERNKFHHARMAGILVTKSGKCSIVENDIFENTHAGIAVGSNASVLIENNSIRNGLSSGILLFDRGFADIKGNKIFKNTVAGIEMQAGSRCRMSENIVAKNKHGILASTDCTVEARGDAIFGNKKFAVKLDDGARVSLGANVCIERRQQALWRLGAGNPSRMYVLASNGVLSVFEKKKVCDMLMAADTSQDSVPKVSGTVNGFRTSAIVGNAASYNQFDITLTDGTAGALLLESADDALAWLEYFTFCRDHAAQLAAGGGRRSLDASAPSALAKGPAVAAVVAPVQQPVAAAPTPVAPAGDQKAVDPKTARKGSILPLRNAAVMRVSPDAGAGVFDERIETPATKSAAAGGGGPLGGIASAAASFPSQPQAVVEDTPRSRAMVEMSA
jgi:parallel beta-helix repeat protein